MGQCNNHGWCQRIFGNSASANNDETMAIVGLIDEDSWCREGGHFVAAVTNEYRGSCLVGWLVKPQAQPSRADSYHLPFF